MIKINNQKNSKIANNFSTAQISFKISTSVNLFFKRKVKNKGNFESMFKVQTPSDFFLYEQHTIGSIRTFLKHSMVRERQTPTWKFRFPPLSLSVLIKLLRLRTKQVCAVFARCTRRSESKQLLNILHQKRKSKLLLLR